MVDMGGLAPWAVLGLRPWGLARVLRAELDRGGLYLLESAPSPRLIRALQALTGCGGNWIVRPAAPSQDVPGQELWRPFLPAPQPGGTVVVRLPLPPGLHLDLLHAEGGQPSAGQSQAPCPQECPDAVPRVALRAAEHLAGVLAGIPERRRHGGHPLPGLPPDALSESWWSRFDVGPFNRVGPYLFHRGPEDSYPELHRHMADAGFLFPADRAIPAIIPLELSPGELAHYLGHVQSVRHGG